MTADQQTIAELARHNQELTAALMAAEERAKKAESAMQLAVTDTANQIAAAREEVERLTAAHGEFERLKEAEIKRLRAGQRHYRCDAEIIVHLRAEVTRVRAVVDAARTVNDVWHGFDEERKFEAWVALNKTLAALDKAQVRMAEVEGVEDPT